MYSEQRLRHRGRKTAIAALATLALVSAAGCSSKSDGETESTTAPADTESVDSTATSEAGVTDSIPSTDVADTAAPATDATETTEAVGSPLGEPNPATDTPITIGFVSDGANASFGSDENLVATFEATIEYANEYLGGIGGHSIELEHCSTENTPAGATQCAVDLTSKGVAAMVVPVSAQDGTLYEGLAGSGIPYFTYESVTSSVLLQPGAFLMTNPISQIAVPGLIAQEQGIDKTGFVIIDVPAATGPITAIAQPIFDNLGVELQVIPIAPSVADMTPSLQEAISGGAGLFTVTGTDDFNISGYNGLRQLGFSGPIVMGNPADAFIDAVSTFDNLLGQGTQTNDPSDPDVALMDAIVAEYTDLDPIDADTVGFAAALGFVRALAGATDAVDAASVMAALNAMPETELPLGAGITFQCGTAPVAFAPNVCSTDVLEWTYDADGERGPTTVVDVPGDVIALG